ncbi:MAG: hypothetical protein ABDH23_04065 [Endomicrobiia bacterium]
MSLMRNKFIFFVLVLFAFNKSIFCEKVIRRIQSDVTEYDRKTNSVNFYGNVKIEIMNGYILCQQAYYKENENIICEKDVYFVYTSTLGPLDVEIKCLYLYYDMKNKQIEFKNNIYAIYKSTSYFDTAEYGFSKAEVKCNYINLDTVSSTMIFKENVVVFTEDTTVFCDFAEYKYKDKFLLVNSDLDKKIKFESLSEKLRIKTCHAKLATIDFDKQVIILNGKVEIIF